MENHGEFQSSILGSGEISLSLKSLKSQFLNFSLTFRSFHVPVSLMYYFLLVSSWTPIFTCSINQHVRAIQIPNKLVNLQNLTIK